MAGRPPILNNEEETIRWYINLYYKRLEENPDVKFDLDEHIKLIYEINNEYLKALRNREFNFEKYEGCFIEAIDFLTKVFTRKKEREEQDKEKKELLSRLRIK